MSNISPNHPKFSFPDCPNERGMALLTVLWILVIFTALIATLSHTAILHTRMSGVLANMGHSTDMAETGIQAWMAQARSDAIPVENNVIISEIMSEYPDGSPIQLNEIDAHSRCPDGDSNDEFVEIVNQSSSSIDISGFKITYAGGSQFGTDFTGSLAGKSATKMNETYYTLPNGGETVKLQNNNGEVVDSYTYPSTDPGGGNSYQKQDDATGSWTTDSCSLGSVNTSVGPYNPPDKFEFVELYNTNSGDDTNDTIAVAADYQIEDELDSSGSPNNDVYNIKVHPNDPYGGTDGNLAPDQIGLIVHENLTTSELNDLLQPDLNTVRVYYLEADGNPGTPQFFTGGLYNDEQEDLTLKRGGGDYNVLDSDNWDPPDPKPKVSRYKTPKLSTGENSNDNWAESGTGGTPGRVPTGDSHLDPWGWGGTILEGIPMTSKVFLPSVKSNRQDNDYGYFQIKNIEDESGKIDLLEDGRSTNDELDPPDGASEDRDFPSSTADEVRQFANGNCSGDNWYTLGTFFTNDCSDNSLTASSIETWERYQHVYSGLRLPQDGSDKKININTAPYTALKTIKMCNSCSPEYLPRDLTKEIIKFRSGEIPDKENGYYKIPNEDYTNGDETAITDPDQICNISAFKNHSEFDCNVFKQNVKIGSEGIFRVIVKGVTLKDNGDTKTTTTIEAIIDREKVVQKTGPMKILYKRQK